MIADPDEKMYTVHVVCISVVVVHTWLRNTVDILISNGLPTSTNDDMILLHALYCSGQYHMCLQILQVQHIAAVVSNAII